MVARAKIKGFIHWSGEHPKKYVPAHNGVHPMIANRVVGDAGFIAIWIAPQRVKENWVKCLCGWRPDLGAHYRHRSDGGHPKVRAATPSGLIYG